MTIDTIRNRKDNLYMYLSGRDVIGKLRPILKNKGYVIRNDGRWIRVHFAAWETPWVHQYTTPNQECELWHDLFFDFWKQVPTYCMDCWKVVVMPRTVVELFDLYELQKTLEHPCKCGIELRQTDDRLYGGYFYNWGKKNGEKCYKMVRKAVSEAISPEVNVILKCACTEYEISCGPPAEWKPDAKQLFIEKAIKEYVLPSTEMFYQHDYMQAYIMLKWIHHAASHHDMTYKELTGGGPITFSAKTYHQDRRAKNG